MADVSIICDASFDDKLKVAGFSGYLQITLDDGQQITQMYDSARAECTNVQESEIYAMHLGLLNLKRYLSANDLQIGRITIHTDSLTSINAMNDVLSDPNARTPLKSILLKMNYFVEKNGWNYRLKKVNAHVPNHRATAIEKIHNIVDMRAVSARMAFTNHIFKPKIDKSKWYSVILPATYNDDESAKHEQLGYSLAKSGHKGRIFILNESQSGDVHPFINGILLYADEANLSMDQLMTQMFYVPNTPKESLDISLYRYHRTLLNLKVYDNVTLPIGGTDNPTTSENNAYFASSFLFGPAYRGLEIHNMTGRSQDASAFVLDLTPDGLEPNSIPAWIHQFLHYTAIPLKVGFEMNKVQLEMIPAPGDLSYISSVNLAGKTKPELDASRVPENFTLKRKSVLTDPSLLKSLKTLYENVLNAQGAGVSAHTLTRLLVGTLSQFGYPITQPAALESLERNVYCAISKKRPTSESDVPFILKHINKMRLIDPQRQEHQEPSGPSGNSSTFDRSTKPLESSKFGIK